jgi:hypothetical protein
MESTLKAQSMNDNLSQDQFLFSCKEALVARTTKKGFDSHLRYDPFLFGTYQPPQSRTVTAFRRELAQIFSHSFNETAQFRRQETIDLETISFFSLAIATLIADTETLLLAYGGIRLPCTQGVPRAVKDNDPLPALAALFASFSAHTLAQEGLNPEDAEPFSPFPLDEPGDAAADATRVAEEFWGVVFTEVKRTFPRHHSAIVSFVRWHFQPEPEQVAIDWRTRPPVGEAFSQYLRSIQGSRAGAHSSRNGRFNGEGREPRSPRGAPPDTAGNRPRGGENRGSRGPTDGRPARNAFAGTRAPLEPHRPHREAAGPETPSNNQEAGGDLSSGRSPEELQRLTEQITQEVEHNIRILQKNSRRPGIRLKPQNSFFRRIQHMAAIELGYETESVGEGRDRSVYIKNK